MEKRFRKDFSSLEPITAFVRSFAGEQSLDGDTSFALNFVIEELFTNMVKYQPSARNDVSIELTGDGRTLKVRMVDFGVEYFDPTDRPPVDTAKPLSERSPGGLGVHLVKQYVDEFNYEYVGRDSVITLIKTLKDRHV
jgi:anti-sigma regulatory factor (Ser/Thr protein kinase)